MNEKHSKKAFLIAAVVLVIIITATIALTFPVTSKISSEAAGLGSDTHHTIAEILLRFDHYRDIGYARSAWEILSGFHFNTVNVNAALLALFPLPLGYNLYWLFSFVAAAFGMYLLVLEILTHRPGKNRGIKG